MEAARLPSPESTPETDGALSEGANAPSFSGDELLELSAAASLHLVEEDEFQAKGYHVVEAGEPSTSSHSNGNKRQSNGAKPPRSYERFDASGEPTPSSLTRMLEQYSDHKLLTQAQEIELSKRIEGGDLGAKQEMVRSNLKLVISIAKNYRGLGMPFEDLINEGILGLNRGVEKFDYRRGYKFSTYATWWVRQQIQRGVVSQSRTIRLPVHVVERLYQMRKAEDELQMELGRQPTDEELADRACVSLEHLEEAQNAAVASASLDQPINGDNENSSTLGEFYADPHADIAQEAAESSERQDVLRSALMCLTGRQKQVVELRYFGIEDDRPMPLVEVGDVMGITRERVRQIEQAALKKLQAVLSASLNLEKGSIGRIAYGNKSLPIGKIQINGDKPLLINDVDIGVMEHSGKGLTNRQIAYLIGCRDTQVKSSISKLTTKLGTTREELGDWLGEVLYNQK